MRKSSDVEYLHDYAQTQPNAPAIITNGSITNYKELWRLTRGFARYLHNSGFGKGDMFVLKSLQTLDFAVCYFGVHLVGGVIAPVEHSASGDSFERILHELDPKLISVNPENMGTDFGKYDAGKIDNTKIAQLANEFGDIEEDYTYPDEDSLAVIMFTTGTTGVSKGVEHTQKSMIATAENLIVGTEMKNGSYYLIPSPMNHSGPTRKMVTSIMCGGAAVILNGLKNLHALFEAMESAEGPVGCAFPPSAIRTIFILTGDKIGEYKSKIDFIISDSGPLPEPDKERLSKLLPTSRLYVNYGSTEAGSVCMYDYNQFPGKKNCIGRSGINSKIIIVDENGTEIKATKDTPGMIACIGDVNMRGYWHAPELTAQVMKNGAMCSSDIGYIDEDGFIYTFGRKGDVINVGGLKVAPTEVEQAALAFPEVDDCICVPIDDPISGKAVKLCVVVKKGAVLDKRGLRSYLMAHLENYKVPKIIAEIDEVPRTYNGKLDRKNSSKLA